MKHFVLFTLSAFTFICFLVATERQAHAYVDPGSGLLALQSFASVLAGVGFFMRRRIRALFGGRGNQPQAVVTPPLAPEKATRKAA